VFDFEKLAVLAIIAVFLLGPERLPKYAARLGQLVRSLRTMADGAKDRLRDEMGPEFDEVDWKRLDPRQYDPRRIIREALLDDGPAEVKPVSVSIAREPGEESAFQKRSRLDGVPTPFDSEAT
jgi:sec-independent protein translocase protein TatB